jgi:hypothetical protein
MEGEVCRLREIVEVKKKYKARAGGIGQAETRNHCLIGKSQAGVGAASHRQQRAKLLRW